MPELPYHAKKSAWELLAARFGRERPLSAMFEIADRCNEACIHCYQVHGQKGELSTAEVFAALDQLAEMGILFLTLSGGEATLRPDFLEIVAYARKKKFVVKLYSNGLRIDDAMADALAEHAVQEVQLSLYSVRADVHDSVTKVAGSWQRTMDAAERLRARGVGVLIKAPLMKYNHDEVRAFAEMATARGLEFQIDPSGLMPREDGATDPKDHDAEFSELVEARRALDALEAEARRRYAASSARDAEGRVAAVREALADTPALPTRTELQAPKLEGAPCGACANNLHLEANGEIRPCAQLGVSLGNVREQTIAESWQGERSEGIRTLRWKDITGCRVCDLQAYCGRCHHASRAATGDALVPYADACGGARRWFTRVHGVTPKVQGSVEIGPFRHIGEYVFEAFEDEFSERDRALRAAQPWIRAHPGVAPAGGLVQLRRRGASTGEPAEGEA